MHDVIRRSRLSNKFEGGGMTPLGKHILTTLSFVQPKRPHGKAENYRGFKVSPDGIVEGSIADRAMHVMRQLQPGETIKTVALAAVINETGIKTVSRASLSSTMTRLSKCGLTRKTKKGMYQRA